MNGKETSRRRFLAGAVAATGLVIGAGLFGCNSAAAQRSYAESRRDLDQYRPAFFSGEEWLFIVAACDRLIPADVNGPGALQANVPIFIDKQMLTDYGSGGLWYMSGPFYPDSKPEFGYQYRFSPREIYRQGIAELGRHSLAQYGNSFDQLDENNQDALLTSLEKGQPQLGAIPAGVFFSQLLVNTREGYFADPMYGGNEGMEAWKMLGFPGARGDYREFVRLHNKPYPYGPKSIQGQEA